MITWRQTVFVMGFASVAGAQTDPRVGLAGGHYVEAADASSNMRLIAHKDRPQPFFNPADPGDFYVINSDLAFRDNLVFQGNFYGIQIWDVSDIRNPTLKTSLVCPGGQGDPSVYGNLMFMSVEMPNGRVDCGTQGVKDTVSPDRFRGVRIFDISDVEHPKQIAAVQTCRGSHTHTLIPDPKDKNVLWVYVQGLVPPRPAGELAGCSRAAPEQDPNTSLFRIDIIKVPLDHPQDAKVVAGPRIFALNGQINGLWKGGKHGEGTQETNQTDQCHDITAYPAIGLAAGACSGNGILLDITNPGEPKRVGEVTDPNFAYFHSATFSNDGKKVIFTDEWGGGTLPRCRASDPKNWGADAIFSIGADHKLTLDGYFKMPAPQTETENCVAHNGSLVPVPGRDILAQGWYQGGVSIYDFTDPAHAQEIAFFDRGPLDTKKLYIAGDWAAYWYNGYVYGSEIARGLDIFELQPSQYLSKNEIDAAKLVKIGTSNPSDQPKIVWPAAFVVARAYLDQLERMNGLGTDRITAIRGDLDKAEQMSGAQQKSALQKLAKQTEGDAKNAKDAERVRWLTSTIKGIAGDRAGNGG
ncbi:MAG TPA: hypothetical protein VK679_14710 [Gemmatimonadaceae bacterium]|nr:hypothetical protein [Gemmatimonadaceae bacterium]